MGPRRWMGWCILLTSALDRNVGALATLADSSSYCMTRNELGRAVILSALSADAAQLETMREAYVSDRFECCCLVNNECTYDEVCVDSCDSACATPKSLAPKLRSDDGVVYLDVVAHNGSIPLDLELTIDGRTQYACGAGHPCTVAATSGACTLDQRAGYVVVTGDEDHASCSFAYRPTLCAESWSLSVRDAPGTEPRTETLQCSSASPSVLENTKNLNDNTDGSVTTLGNEEIVLDPGDAPSTSQILDAHDPTFLWWVVAIMCVVVVLVWLSVWAACHARSWLWKYRHRTIYTRRRTVHRNRPIERAFTAPMAAEMVPPIVNPMRVARVGGTSGMSRAEYFRR